MSFHQTTIAVGAAIALAASQAALAQDYNLSWHTIGGGGKTNGNG